MSDRYALPGDVLLREHAYVTRVYLAKTGEGEDLDTVRKPEFWVQLVKAFRIRDVLEVIADDGSFEWHGRVVRKEAGEVWLREMFCWRQPADAAEPPLRSGHRLGWNDKTNKYAVLGPSGNVLKRGFDDKGEARDWLRRYLDGEAGNG